MKLKNKYISLAVVAMLFCPRLLLADEKIESVNHKNMSITIDVGYVLFGSVPLRFGYKVAKKIELGISGYGTFFGFGNSKVLGVGGGVDAKFCLSANCYEDGWFVKPGIEAGYLGLGDSKSSVITGFVTAGYGWAWESGFIMDLGLGFAYKHRFISYAGNKKEDSEGFGVYGAYPYPHFAIGFAF